MADLYNDLYMRANLNDQGLIPRTGSLSCSPDIIPWGTSPVSDPVTFFTNNFSQDVGKDVSASQLNYFYVRGKNLAQAAASGKISIYYSQASLLLWPNLWSKNSLKTAGGSSEISVSAAESGDIFVAQDPFTWIPVPPPPGDHYCMVSRVVTDSHPNPIPSPGSIQDFAAWISTSPGFAWRNINVVSTNVPTFTDTMYYEQGDADGEVTFLLRCTNVPKGASVALTCGTPGPVPLIDVPQTTVTNSESFVVGVTCRVPAGFISTITYSYWANGTNPPPGWKLECEAIYITDSSDKALHRIARPVVEFGLNDHNTFCVNSSWIHSKKSSSGKKRGIRIGNCSTIGNTQRLSDLRTAF
jgi:hypothetical protein